LFYEAGAYRLFTEAKLVKAYPEAAQKYRTPRHPPLFIMLRYQERHRFIYRHMIKSLSDNIVNQMIVNDVIDKADSEYYSYRILTLSESFVTVLTILIISVILGKLDLAVIFLTSFMLLRKQAGGLHLDSFAKCYIASVIFCVFSITLVEYIPVNNLSLIVTVLSVLIIMAVGCVNHPNLDFDETEMSIMKKRARITVMLELLLVIALSVFKVREAVIGSIELAIITCSIFVVLAKLFRQEVSPCQRK
jgi:accessory gene regulator B